MSGFYVVGWLRWAGQGGDLVEGWRERHDPKHGMLPAHVTFVFGAAAMPQALVAGVARHTPPIEMTFPRAICMEGGGDQTLVALAIDAGTNALLRLHERLNPGCASSSVLPHVTIGAACDRATAQTQADTWNARKIAFAARIDTLAIGSLEGGRFRVLAEHTLAGTA